jgi:hypothetical protein
MTKIYLQNPQKTQIVALDNKSQIGAGYDNWIEPSKNEIAEFELRKAKTSKLDELEQFHNEAKTASINENIITIDPVFRAMLQEQIQKLRIRINAGLLKEQDAYFVYWINSTKITLPLKALEYIYYSVLDIIDYNFAIKQETIIEINQCKSVEEINLINYKDKYKINQSIILPNV